MDCWETEPENRPSFDSLCNKIKRLEMGANQVRNPSVWFSDLCNRYKVIFFSIETSYRNGSLIQLLDNVLQIFSC